jgi:hypothetical protein
MGPTEALHRLRADPRFRNEVTRMVIATLRVLPLWAYVDDIEFSMHMRYNREIVWLPIVARIADVTVVTALFPRLERECIAWDLQKFEGQPPLGLVGFLDARPVIAVGVDGSRKRLRFSFIAAEGG